MSEENSEKTIDVLSMQTHADEPQDLMDIVVNNLDLKDGLVKYLNGKNARIKLDKNGAQVLHKIIESMPKLIDDIGARILTIVSDDVIDMNDLPTFILLVKDIVNINVKDLKKIKVTRGDIADMIEAIIFILIDTDVIKTGDNKDSFLALLKLSMQILDASVELDKTIGCSCF